MLNRANPGRFVRIHVLWSSLFLAVTQSFFCSLPSTSGDALYPAAIIAPSAVRPGELLPVVVRLEGESAGNVNGAFPVNPSEIEGENIALKVKKGVGSQTLKINAGTDFRLHIESLAGEKEVHIVTDQLQKNHSGTTSSREIWDASVDHRISDSLVIPAGSTVEIGEGTRVLLGEKATIIVYGSLYAAGSMENPVLFTASHYSAPWGGIEIWNSAASFEYCFFTNGGADTAKAFSHANCQPLLLATDSEVKVENCFFIDNAGKGIGGMRSVISLSHCCIARCESGGEFLYCVVDITGCHISDIPNDDGVPVDNDNDGFYFNNPHLENEEPSTVSNSYFITGKDDAIDHNNARLEVSDCWIEGFLHEGVAASEGEHVSVYNTVIKDCEQGVEAGYGSPAVTVDHCVIVNNDVGLRFGDSYDVGCSGKVTVTNTIAFNNGDNVYNFDMKTGAAVPGGISISYSLVNDEAFDRAQNCISGIPEFDENWYLREHSVGIHQGIDNSNLGLIRHQDTIEAQ